MVAFGFTQDKKTLDREGLLPNNTHTALVRNLKTDLVIMSCCNSSDCTPTLGTPLRLSDILKAMTNKLTDKEMQCSNWTMDTNLSQRAKDYGAFDAYVIWYLRNIMDWRLQALGIT